MARWLLTADLQLQNFPEFASLNKEGYNTRLVALLEGLTGLLRTHSPDAIVIAGDIWNNKAALETDLLDLTHRYFRRWKELGPEIILLLGNHDTAFLSASIHSLRQFEAYCKVVTTAEVYRGIAFSPWRAEQLAIEADLDALAGKAPFLIGHWTVKGAATNSYLSEGGIDPEEALRPDAPLLHEEAGTNVIVSREFKRGDVEAASASAAVRVTGRFRMHRKSPVAIEPPWSDYRCPRAGIAF